MCVWMHNPGLDFEIEEKIKLWLNADSFISLRLKTCFMMRVSDIEFQKEMKKTCRRCEGEVEDKVLGRILQSNKEGERGAKII